MKPRIVVLCEFPECQNDALWERPEDGVVLCEACFQIFGKDDGISIHNGVRRWAWLATGANPLPSEPVKN